jgi:ankyrin repeat protein
MSFTKSCSNVGSGSLIASFLLIAGLGGRPAYATYYGDYNYGNYVSNYSGYYSRKQSPPPVISLSLDPQDILNSAFRVAAREERLDDMEHLLAQHADINACSDTGETALMYAARNCSTVTVKVLLSHEADVNIQDREGRTALIYAAQDSCAPVIELLLKSPQIRVKHRDSFDKAAIDYARESAELDVSGQPIEAIEALEAAYARRTEVSNRLRAQLDAPDRRAH